LCTKDCKNGILLWSNPGHQLVNILLRHQVHGGGPLLLADLRQEGPLLGFRQVRLQGDDDGTDKEGPLTALIIHNLDHKA